MTNKEAAHIVDVAFDIPQAVRRAGENRTYHEDEIREAKSKAIEAMKQKPILDKIRAEIEEYKSRQLTVAIGVADLEKGKQIALECVLAIIDRYKSESEDKL